MRRGDLREMSFAGFVTRDAWAQGEDGTPERSVMEWALEDVSLVTRAAYPAAYSNLRTADALESLEIAKRRFALL
jgi:phage head maturation protease